MGRGDHSTVSQFPGAPPEPPLTISVVTPSLNQGRFLRQCVESVLDQDYPGLEYLVMDGGSVDSSVSILRTFEGRLRWRSQPDAGQASAINQGIRETRGEYILWLNSDDYLLPGALDALARCARANPDAEMIYARADMVNQDGGRIRAYPTFAFRRSDLRRKCYVCQPGVLIKRSAFERVGLLSEALELCFDYELWLRIGREGKLVHCDALVAASRHYGQTKTASRRLRGLIEAGYLMRAHFGVASARWSVKWVARRWSLDRSRFLTPIGWCAALGSARRYRRRFDARREASVRGRRLLAALERPPMLSVSLAITPAPEPKLGTPAPAPEGQAGAAAS